MSDEDGSFVSNRGEERGLLGGPMGSSLRRIRGVMDLTEHETLSQNYFDYPLREIDSRTLMEINGGENTKDFNDDDFNDIEPSDLSTPEINNFKDFGGYDRLADLIKECDHNSRQSDTVEEEYSYESSDDSATERKRARVEEDTILENIDKLEECLANLIGEREQEDIDLAREIEAVIVGYVRIVRGLKYRNQREWQMVEDRKQMWIEDVAKTVKVMMEKIVPIWSMAESKLKIIEVLLGKQCQEKDQ